jgi:hypothetical protein
MLAEYRAASHSVHRPDTPLIKTEVTAGDRRLRARVTGTVRAPVRLVISSFMTSSLNRFRARQHETTVVDVGATALTEEMTQTWAEYKMPFPLQNRDIALSNVWERTGPGKFFHVSESSDSRPLKEGVFVRMHETLVCNFCEVAANKTKIELVIDLDLGGHIPRAVTNSLVVPMTQDWVIDTMRFFAQVREPGDYTVEDGKELGLLLMLKLHPHRNDEALLRASIGTAFERCALLSAVRVQHEGVFEELLFAVLRNRVRPAKGTKVPLARLGRGEAAAAGRMMATLLLSNATAHAAVDELIHANVALAELDRM